MTGITTIRPNITTPSFAQLNNDSCEVLVPYVGQVSIQNYLMTTLSLLLLLIGLLGNFTVVFIILRQSKMLTPPNLLFVNVSMGDIVFLLGNNSFLIPSHLASSFEAGAFVCGLMEFVYFSCLGVSIFTLTAMAVDRFRAIRAPFSIHKTSKRHTIIVMVMIWVFSMSLALPVAMITEVQSLQYNCFILKWCTKSQLFYVNQVNTVVWIQFILYFGLPFIVITICYVIISYTLCDQQTNNPALFSSTNQNLSPTYSSTVNSPTSSTIMSPVLRRQIEGRKKLSLMVIAFIFIFVVCRLPRESHELYLAVTGTSLSTWQYVGNLFTQLNSCINPLVLCVLSQNFRQLVTDLYCCNKSSRNNSNKNFTVNNTFNRHTNISTYHPGELAAEDINAKKWKCTEETKELIMKNVLDKTKSQNSQNNQANLKLC